METRPDAVHLGGEGEASEVAGDESTETKSEVPDEGEKSGKETDGEKENEKEEEDPRVAGWEE